jgi:protease YdgD
MKYSNLLSVLSFSALYFCSINTAFSQTAGIPSPLDGQPTTKKIEFNLGFGDDDRIPMRSNAYPWSAVGRVQINGGGHCTGALIGRDLVLTNAHCIWNQGSRREITFAPNYKNGQSPETAKGVSYLWGTDNPEQNRRSDWAIIRLERPIGDRYGWFGYHSLDYQQLQGREVNYVGYSTFRDEKVKEFVGGKTAQVHIGCRVRDVLANMGVFHTDCDNGQGGSGGPIFIWQGNQPVIIGINAAEYRGETSAESFFAQQYTPGRGNVSVPTLTFSRTALQAARQSDVSLQGVVHLQKIGDVPFQSNAFAGTRGESRRLEGFSLAITDSTPNLELQYMAHLQNRGDTSWAREGQFIGTRGESLRLEGFAIRLSGAAATNYNVYYFCHVQGIGDTSVMSNGQFCGTRGGSRRIEGLQVWIKRK